MTPERYRFLLGKIGMSLVGAAKFFEIDERTSRRWASGDYDIPVANALALEAMYRFKVSPDQARKWLGLDPVEGINRAAGRPVEEEDG